MEAGPSSRAASLESTFLAHRAFISHHNEHYNSLGIRTVADYWKSNAEKYKNNIAVIHILTPTTSNPSNPHTSLTNSSLSSSSTTITPSISSVRTSPPYTYSEVDSLANQYSHFFLSQRISPLFSPSFQVIALFCENCPHFIALWIALSKIGLRIALLNTNLTGLPLKQAIKTAKAKHIIVSNGLKEGWEKIEWEEEIEEKEEGGGWKIEKVWFVEGAEVE